MNPDESSSGLAGRKQTTDTGFPLRVHLLQRETAAAECDYPLDNDWSSSERATGRRDPEKRRPLIGTIGSVYRRGEPDSTRPLANNPLFNYRMIKVRMIRYLISKVWRVRGYAISRHIYEQGA